MPQAVLCTSKKSALSCYNLFLTFYNEPLFVDYYKMKCNELTRRNNEEKERIEKNRQEKIEKKRIEIARIPEDLKRIEEKFISHEIPRIRRLDEKNGYVFPAFPMEIRKQCYIERKLTKNQNKYLKTKVLDLEEKNKIAQKKIQKEKKRLGVFSDEWDSFSKKYTWGDICVMPLVCTYVVAFEILKKTGLNYKKLAQISCISLMGYAVCVIL